MRKITDRAEFTATVGPRSDTAPWSKYTTPHVYLFEVTDAEGRLVAEYHSVSRRAGVWDGLRSGDVIAFNADRHALSRPRNFRLVRPRDDADLSGPADRAAFVHNIFGGYA